MDRPKANAVLLKAVGQLAGVDPIIDVDDAAARVGTKQLDRNNEMMLLPVLDRQLRQVGADRRVR